eukprot:Opistho-2@748
MMCRDKVHEMPKMQLGFIDFICLPAYKMLSSFDAGLKPLYDGVVDNRRHWEELGKRGEYRMLLPDAEMQHKFLEDNVDFGFDELDFDEPDPYAAKRAKEGGGVQSVAQASTSRPQTPSKLPPLEKKDSVVAAAPAVVEARKASNGTAPSAHQLPPIARTDSQKLSGSKTNIHSASKTGSTASLHK